MVISATVWHKLAQIAELQTGKFKWMGFSSFTIRGDGRVFTS